MSPASAWRSLLFVPAHQPRFIDAARRGEADACVLDLEDSVPPAQKPPAREAFTGAAKAIAEGGKPVLVRINAPWRLAVRDLEAAVGPSVSAIVAPKVEARATLNALDELLADLEGEAGLPIGKIGVIAQIESVNALPRLDDICTGPRLIGLSLGSEDFSASAGMTPSSRTLMAPNQEIVFACRRHGLLPFGFPGSIADYADVEAFGETARLASEMGFGGAFCIHPRQVAILNRAFTPDPAALEQALRILEAYRLAVRQGRGATVLDGRMIDPPVVAQAQALLARARPNPGVTAAKRSGEATIPAALPAYHSHAPYDLCGDPAPDRS